MTAVAWFDAVAWDAQAEAGKPRATRQSESGRITAVLALQGLVNGGRSGQYGIGQGATALTLAQ